MRFLRHRIHVIGFSLLACFLFSVETFAQNAPGDLETVLGEQILAPSAALLQMKSFILSRVPPPPVATSAAQWTEESQRLRRHLLQDVVFHGWPPEWVTASPKFEDVGTIETHEGYRLRKLRYEVVPGFQSVAILYEPEKLQGKVPAILNVNGHVGAPARPWSTSKNDASISRSTEFWLSTWNGFSSENFGRREISTGTARTST